MAEIRIQPKKSAPSPWLLVLLAGTLLALAAYFFLRPDPVDPPAAAGSLEAAPPPAAPPAADPITNPGAAASAEDTADATPLTPAGLAAYAATDVAAPDYARRGLQQLVAALVDLADRTDLQDAAVQEQRNNLTSATARLSDDATASLRPGFVAAAGLLQAIQQKAYPEQAPAAAQLVQQAGQLAGRTATVAEQQQVRGFLNAAVALLEPLSQPPAAP